MGGGIAYGTNEMPLLSSYMPEGDKSVARLQGGGIAYGTKEGRLRILRHAAGAPRPASSGPSARGDWRYLVDELVEADQVAAAAIPDLPSSDDDA